MQKVKRVHASGAHTHSRAIKKRRPAARQTTRVPVQQYDADRVHQALYRIADAASAVKDLPEFYAAMHRIVGELMYAKSFYITLYDPATGIVSSPYFVDAAGDLPPPPVSLEEHSTSLRAYVLRTGETLHVSAEQIEAGQRRGKFTPMGTPAEDWVGVPLKMEGQTIGSLTLQSYEKGVRYTEQDVKLLEFVAQHIATALTRARAIEETRQRNAELAIINSVQQALASQLDMQSIFDLIGDKIREIFDAQVVDIITYDRVTDLASWQYAYEKGVHQTIAPRAPIGFSGHILKTRQALMFNQDVAQRMQEYGSVVIAGDVPQSYVGVPLIIGDEARGVMSLQNIDRENAFTDADLRLLQTLANTMSVALENARLFGETQRLLKESEDRAAELQIINRVGRVLTQKLELQKVIDLVGDELRAAIHVDSLGIGLYDQTTRLLQPRYVYKNNQRYYPEPTPLSDFTLYVARQGKSLVVNHNTPRLWQKFGSNLTVGTEIPKSLIMVPILAGKEFIGGVTIQDFERENAYSDSTVRLLETIAANIGTAIRNARLFDEVQTLLAMTTRLSELSARMLSATTVEATARFVTHALQEAFTADVVSLNLLEANGQFKYWDSEGLPGEFYQRGQPRADGLTMRALKSAEPLIVHDVALLSPATRALGVQSTIALPLRDEKTSLGVLFLNYRQRREFTQREIEALSLFANQTALALKRLHLVEETQRRAAELAIINSVQEALATKLDQTGIVEMVGEKVREIFHVDAVMIRFFDLSADRVSFPYVYYRGERRTIKTRPIRGFGKQIVEMRQPIIVNHGLAEYAARAGSRLFPWQEDWNSAMLAVPILTSNQVIGAITLFTREGEHEFDQADVNLLATIASAMSVALENARLFDETQRLLKETEQRAAELAIVNSIGQAFASQLELDALIRLVGDKMRETFNAQIVYVALLDHTTNLIHFPYYNESGQLRVDPPLPFGQGLTSKIIQTREPLLINQNVEQRRTELGVVRQGTPAKSYLGVPILVGSQAIGVISVQSTEQEGRFDEADLRLLNTIAAGVGVAIDKARLYATAQNQKQYFEGIVSNSPVAIVTVDLDSHIVEWNPAAEKLFGYTKAEALGRNVDDLIALSDEIRAEAAACSLKAMRGELASYLTRRNRRDGSLVDVQMWAVPVSVNDTRVGAIALYNDISELVRARREAESANQAKSAFLATMSHEIRTPMNAVIGMSNLLLGTNLNEEQREYASIIHHSGDALLTIINDILDFSKIEAGKMELDNQPFDLRECVESALDLVTTRATEKGIDLAYVIEDGVPAAIRGDAARLRQVLLNLLSNAVKFTEHGEVVLTVSSGGKGDFSPLHPSPLAPLHFSVRDTGIGISPEQQERLFQSFSQADASTSRKYGGTGLGLAISKRLVELMRGTIWVESGGAGKGSTFHFTIQAQAALDFVPQTRTYPVGEQPLLRGKRVLVVDDNATNRRILTRQLQLWGLTLQDTESPREALAWLARGDSFDVAILDMQLPELDGAQLAIEIRKQCDAARLPLILFSSLGRREAGADDALFAAYITKPLKPSALFDVLVNLLAPVPAQAAAKPVPTKPQFDPQMATRLPLRILLVEDNAVNQKLALRILSQLGYRADVAANGIEALQAIARQKYDVALMDVQMPEMDGLEATRQIVARWQRGARPRIVAMTANVTQGDREICLAAGMDDYIAKPIRVEELIAALTKAGPTNG